MNSNVTCALIGASLGEPLASGKALLPVVAHNILYVSHEFWPRSEICVCVRACVRACVRVCVVDHNRK